MPSPSEQLSLSPERSWGRWEEAFLRLWFSTSEGSGCKVQFTLAQKNVNIWYLGRTWGLNAFLLYKVYFKEETYKLRRIKWFVIATHWLALVVHQELFKIPPEIIQYLVSKVFFNSLVCVSSPNVILVVGLIVELVRGLEFGPNWRTPTFQEFINWVLIFPVHIRLGKHLEVRHEIIAGSHMAKHRVDLAGICARLLQVQMAEWLKWSI